MDFTKKNLQNISLANSAIIGMDFYNLDFYSIYSREESFLK
jgi:hypothetical protein